MNSFLHADRRARVVDQTERNGWLYEPLARLHRTRQVDGFHNRMTAPAQYECIYRQTTDERIEGFDQNVRRLNGEDSIGTTQRHPVETRCGRRDRRRPSKQVAAPPAAWRESQLDAGYRGFLVNDCGATAARVRVAPPRWRECTAAGGGRATRAAQRRPDTRDRAPPTRRRLRQRQLPRH